MSTNSVFAIKIIQLKPKVKHVIYLGLDSLTAVENAINKIQSLTYFYYKIACKM